jgi:hypothetical protein
MEGLSKECTFCYDPLPDMALHRQFLFLIGQFLKISSSETVGQINRNLAGSIYGMSSMKIAHFVSVS